MATADTSSLNGKAADEEVLSLEEILAEGLALSPKASVETKTPHGPSGPGYNPGQNPLIASKLSKAHLRRLQEALYHACEAGHVEMALDLRTSGVPWTLFTWLQALRVAHDGHAAAVVTELLQDFRPDWLDERASVLTLSEEGLPLLFSVFRACGGEAATLMLADIFALCFAKTESHKVELQVGTAQLTCPIIGVASSFPQIFQKQFDDDAASSPRIDPRFVNSPELSDVQFRVDGRTFYAHRLALVSASPRFRSMLSSRFSGGDNAQQPVLQINDIRYEIFHLVRSRVPATKAPG
jgi:ankyrin repeat/BTB/POZ domain-containing protein 2